MCIIVTKEKNAKPLDTQVFENCWDNNPDGAGILFHDGKTSTLIKGIMNKKEFLEKVKLANKKENSFIIHTRIATHGSVKPENTHPFVSDTLGFAHNGTMPIEPLKDRTDSESFFLWTIADKNFDWCKENKFLLDMATHGSRCVVFDMRTGEMLHLCEDDWKTDPKYKGATFSNNSYSYKKYQQYLPGTNYNSYNSYGSYGSYDWERNRWSDDKLDWDDIAYESTNTKAKEAFQNVKADQLKINKKGYIACVYQWVEMCLESFAQKGGQDKRKIVDKIKELEETFVKYSYSIGKYDFETNAFNVIRHFLDIAHSKGYHDYKSLIEALDGFMGTIYEENQDTSAFVRELESVKDIYL